MFKEIGSPVFNVKMARVHIKYKNLNKEIEIGMYEEISAQMLIGNDVIQHLKTINIVMYNPDIAGM